jgi:hypothetical protein
MLFGVVAVTMGRRPKRPESAGNRENKKAEREFKGTIARKTSDNAARLLPSGCAIHNDAS